MSIWIGVDPGSRSGAYAIITENGVTVKPWDNDVFCADMRNIAFDIESHKEKAIAVVEKVGAIHGQGLTSTWSFGKNAGFIEGCLSALRISFQLVPPKKWKSEYSLSSDKAKSIEVCHRLFPNVSLRRTDKCRTDDNNFAEAVLMAEYARRKYR